MRLIDRIYRSLLPGTAYLFISLFTATLRIRAFGEQSVHDLRGRKERLVYVFWHGRQFLLVRYMAGKKIAIMSSTSRDGLLQAAILRRFRYGIIYGSSAKSPVRALVGAVDQMRRGMDVAFAVDGPTGPIYVTKPGALFLAKKMNAWLVPVCFSSKPALTLKSWDRYLLPAPFGRAAMVFGKPYRPEEAEGQEALEKEGHRLHHALMRIMKEADRLAGK